MKLSDGRGEVEVRLEEFDDAIRVTLAPTTPGLDGEFWRERLEALRDYAEAQP